MPSTNTLEMSDVTGESPVTSLTSSVLVLGIYFFIIKLLLNYINSQQSLMKILRHQW